MTHPESEPPSEPDRARNWKPLLIIAGAALAVFAALWITTIILFQSL